MADLHKLFNDILSMNSIKGVMLVSHQGDILFKEFLGRQPTKPDNNTWWELFIGALDGIQEADLVFEKNRLYVRKADSGYLMILTGLDTSISMLRLNCDVVIPSLKNLKPKKGLKGLFKKT